MRNKFMSFKARMAEESRLFIVGLSQRQQMNCEWALTFIGKRDLFQYPTSGNFLLFLGFYCMMAVSSGICVLAGASSIHP